MAKDSAFGDEKKTVRHRKEQPKLTGEVKYADAPFVDDDNAEKLEKVRSDHAKNADKPTTASGEIGQKDLPSLVQQIDPGGQGQVIPQLYQKMQQITSILSIGSGGMGGSGGNQTPTNDAGLNSIINDSFTGALAILTRRYGFENVIWVFNNALQNGGINQIDAAYRPIVLNALSNLIRLALYFGPLNIPVSQYDDTIYGDVVPSPLVTYSEVPDLYVKQYYTLSEDPFPGYDEWLSPDGTKKVYVKKDAKSYRFSTANEETFSTSEQQIAAALEPYFTYLLDIKFLKYLTATELNTILTTQMNNVSNNMNDLGVGKNSNKSSNMSSMLGGMLSSLIGQMTSQINLQDSVLKGGGMDQTMSQYKKDMGLNNQIFQLGKGALGGGSPLGSLGGMGGAGNILGGFQSGGGGLSGVLGNMGSGSLMGGYGSFGGNSGGGGGAAGSGYGGYSGGNYNGGDVSAEGLKNIQDLLTLLGIS